MTTSIAPTRTVDGIELPAPGRWVVDPGHAEVAFIGRHFMLTKVRGRFTGIDATVDIGDDPADTTLTATIDMASVASGDAARDDHLRSGDFFDVEDWPHAVFAATSVAWKGKSGTVHGLLRIKDVERPITLDVDYVGYARDPWGNDRAVFDATTTINREDWGLTWNMVLDSGGLLVSKEITLELHIELVRAAADEGDRRIDIAL